MPSITKQTAETRIANALKKYFKVESVIVRFRVIDNDTSVEATVFYRFNELLTNFTVLIYSFNSSMSFNELLIAAEAKAKSIACKKTTIIKFE